MNSPLPKKKEFLTFPEAMNEIVAKRKVRNPSWEEGYYGFLNEGRLRLVKPDGSTHDWIISEGDLNNEYIIIN